MPRKRRYSTEQIIIKLHEASKAVPVIERRYPVSEVPEAIRYLEEGHARGKVVITVSNSHFDHQQG